MSLNRENIENGYFISRGKIELIEKENKTKVIWNDNGEVFKNPFLKYFIYLTDGFTGKEIEQSLINLKFIIENSKN